jgi:transcriptional regulator with XRE-family HTH domain
MRTNGNSKRFISSKDIGRAIKQRRIALGMSQEKLSEYLDVSYQQVQRYENGSSKLNVENVQAVAEALDIPVTIFFDPDNLLSVDMPHPYNTDDEHELLTSFRSIKQSQNKDIVIGVSRMAAQVANRPVQT